MVNKFLTSTTQGQALNVGDQVYSAYHDRRGIAENVWVDSDGDVYIKIRFSDNDSGQAHIRNVVRINS